MEEKNEFSDILLERESEAKASRFKKIALIAGSFILIFLLVLVIMKMLNKPSGKNDNSRLVIQPKNTQVKKDDPLFKEVPIIKQDDKKESFEEMVRKLKEKENQRILEEKQEAEKTKAPEINDIEKKEISKEETAPIKTVKEPMKQMPIKKEVSKKVQPVAAVKPVKPKPTKTVKKKEVRIPIIPSPKKNTTSGNVKQGTYIQVLATTQTKPDKKYLTLLSSKGYTYHLHRTTIKNRKYLKILVGPYGGYSSAKRALSKVQKDINNNAFIFTLK